MKRGVKGAKTPILDFGFFSPTYDIRHTTYFFKFCNIFTIVRSAECRVRSGECKIMIEFLTGWILKAFLSFVPKIQGRRMGTGQLGDKGLDLPSNFFPNLRIFFFFFNLYPLYFILQSASSQPPLFQPQSLSPRDHSLSKQGLSLSKQGHSLSPGSQSLSPRGHSLSPQRALLSPGGELLLFWEEVARWQGGKVGSCQVALDEDAVKLGTRNHRDGSLSTYN